MRINQLTVDNFRVFSEEVSFDFESAALILCDAPNGSGKTTLLDAIEWCLTGDIGRLSAAYSKRLNGTEQKRQYNLKTILKNKSRLNDKTKVSLQIVMDDNTYTIIREQNNDTLLNPGIVSVYDGDNKILSEQILEEWTQKGTFYQYHIFDMQKAYNLLGTDKESIEKFFVDFTRQHDEAYKIASNLELFQNDINRKKADLLQKKTSDDKLLALREKVNNHVYAPEILQYEKKLLYENENVEINVLSKMEMNEQLKKLYGCGYSKICELVKILLGTKRAEHIKVYLEFIKKEIDQYPQDIKEFIDQKFYDENQRSRINAELLKLKQISLTRENIEREYKQIVGLGNKEFTKDYWKSEWQKVQDKNVKIKDLQDEIKVLTDGDNILNLLTSLLAEKNSVIEYRDKLRASEEKILCPLCGSGETFSRMEDNEILKQAEKYGDDHAKLLENKKKKLKQYEDSSIKLLDQIIEKANMVLQERIIELSDAVEKVDLINKRCMDYYTYVKKLQILDSEKYSFESMKLQENISKYLDEITKQIIDEEKYVTLENEIEKVLKIIGYSSEGKSYEEILRDAEHHSEEVPKIIDYNRELLSKKVSSIHQYINNKEFIDIKEELKKLEDENKKIEEDVNKLDALNELAQIKVEKIRSVLLELRKDEYNKVGPYLSKIFRKLSRDIHIKGFKLGKRDSNRGNNELEIVDEENRPIMNMLSDGQLSVFMLSYFLGNAFRLADKEKFSVYMMDDVTSCMDDVNMLAFLDLIKYQLLKEKGAFTQLFFASCNKRVQDLLEWKANGCGIKYKRIVLNDFVK